MNDRKRIALISVHGDPAVEIGKEEAGGQNVYVRKVGEALARLGWTVDLFTRATDPQQPKIIEHCPGCRTLRLTAGKQAFIHRDHIFGYAGEFVENVLAFQQANGIEHQLFHTNYWISGWVGMQLKQRLSRPTVHTYHSLGAVKYRSVQKIPEIANTRLQVEKDCLERSNRTIATSPQERDHMRAYVSQLGQIEIIPCGTDITHFKESDRAVARAKLGITADAKVAFYIGRFDERKGIETLVRAIGRSQFRDDPRLRLIIGGGSRPGHSDGDERERIEAIVEELGLEEISSFPGRIADEDLPLYYAAADVCVVPSHYEPFGLVAIEAMASGTPVVASDVGGLQFTVASEQTGLLVPPQDDAAFATAIDRILGNPSWRDRLGSQARKRVEEKFSWDGVAEQLSDLYLQILEQTQQSVERTAV